jgi:hypothetical protein
LAPNTKKPSFSTESIKKYSTNTVYSSILPYGFNPILCGNAFAEQFFAKKAGLVEVSFVGMQNN